MGSSGDGRSLEWWESFLKKMTMLINNVSKQVAGALLAAPLWCLFPKVPKAASGGVKGGFSPCLTPTLQPDGTE